MADKDLTFRLFGRDVSASKALQGVGAQAQQTARQVEASSKAASASTIGLGVALGNLMTATAQQAKSMISLGVSTANSMQQAGIGFTTLLGSAQEAGDYLAQLKSFAASTPFEFAGLVDASRLLLGVGVQADMVIPILTDLGDAAGALAIDQESFGRIMLAVSQSISAGTIKLGDMNQLMTNGIPAWKLMSEAMGKPVPVLQDMISGVSCCPLMCCRRCSRRCTKDYGGAMAQQAPDSRRPVVDPAGHALAGHGGRAAAADPAAVGRSRRGDQACRGGRSQPRGLVAAQRVDDPAWESRSHQVSAG